MDKQTKGMRLKYLLTDLKKKRALYLAKIHYYKDKLIVDHVKNKDKDSINLNEKISNFEKLYKESKVSIKLVEANILLSETDMSKDLKKLLELLDLGKRKAK